MSGVPPKMTSAPDTDEHENAKVLSSELIYAGRAVTLRRDNVELATGRRTAREVIEHPGSVGVIPRLEDGKLILIKQFRLPTMSAIWEIPAGTIERGEQPEACARRELEEETGYRAGRMEHLFDAYLAPGYSMELMHFFLATALEKKKREKPDEDEDEITMVEQMEPGNVIHMILSNEIKDAKSMAAIAYLQAAGRLL